MYHCRSCQIKNTVIYLHISPHEISIISSWYPHSQCVFTSSGPFQHWEPRAVWVVEVVLRRISATWRAWVSSLGDDELKLAWFGMKGGGKKSENMDTWTWYIMILCLMMVYFISLSEWLAAIGTATTLCIRKVGILVGGWPTPLKHMSSSVGMMKFPIWWEKSSKCSSHHQPA